MTPDDSHDPAPGAGREARPEVSRRSAVGGAAPARDQRRARPQSPRSRAAEQRRRPAVERRPARPGRREADGAVAGPAILGLSSTRRAAVLALVVCAMVLSVAVPLRNYLAQRGALEDTVQQQEKLREQVDGLEQRRAELSDPAQVEVEARNRLRYVRPGETPYVVQLPNSPAVPPPADQSRAQSEGPWYGQLWNSVAGARQ